MLTLATVLPLILGFGGGICGGGVSGGGVSGGDVRSLCESLIRLIAGGNAVAFGGCTLAFGDYITTSGGSSISTSLSRPAGSKAIFVGLLFSCC